MHAVRSLLLVTKARHPKAEDTATLMATFLQTHGVTCSMLAADVHETILLEAALKVDAVLILGGDGTFVGVSRKIAGRGIPLMGVNFGQVGFLAELDATGWEAHLTSLLAGAMSIRPQTTLLWSLLREGQLLQSGHAINDVVVGRGPLARIVPVRVVVDGESLGWLRADGVIVSTPLGSSAYALSAHGALVHPDVQAMLITPISPFFKSFPPMVLASQHQIQLEPDLSSGEGWLTVDGQEGVVLHDGDVVAIACDATGLSLLSSGADTYFQRLRERGFIQCRDDLPVQQKHGESL